MKNKTTLLIFMVLFSSVAGAEIKRVTLKTKNPIQYNKVDIDIELVAQFSNPYFQEEVKLDMYIKTPSGKELVLPCYFELGESKKTSLWKARFTPQESGEYEYTFSLQERRRKFPNSEKEKFLVSPSSDKGFLQIKSNWLLQFDNGALFRGIGENIGWETRDNDDSKFFKDLHERKDKYNYERMLSELARHGGNFFRTWICSWNLPIDYKGPFNNSRYQESTEYYNPSALSKLDQLVELADSLDIYMMLTLGQGGYTIRDRGSVRTAEAFFSNQEAKRWYKNRLRYIVARWGYSTSIAMWEFFNEVDNIQYSNPEAPIDGDLIVNWHEEMSGYLKRIDPYKHIITTSISHRDIKGLNSVINIDINQKHIYNNTSSIPNEIYKYVTKFQKPYVIGEFGHEWDWSKNFDVFAHNMDVDFKRGLWYGIFSPTPIVPMSWWWEYFDARRLTPYFRGVKEISDRMLEVGNGNFESLSVHAENLEALSVKCGEEIYLYLFNPGDTTVMTDIKISFPEKSKSYRGNSFEPTNRVYNKVNNIEDTDKSITLKNEILGSLCEIVYILSPS